MAEPDTPSFEVRFGRQTSEEDSGMEVLATYVMHGLAQTETSRFERIFQSMDALKLPAGVNDFSIGRRLEAGESYTPTFRVFAGRGIVADLVEPAADEKLDQAPGPVQPIPSPAAIAPIPPFPVKSLFRTSEA